MSRIAKVVCGCLLFWGAIGLGRLDAMAVEGQINVNTAGGKEFEDLPFIGKARAQAIVRYRQKRGGFTSVDDIRQVPEIGEDTFQAIKPYLTIADDTSAPSATGLMAKALPPIVTQPGEIRLLTDKDYYPVLQTMIGQADNRIDLAMFLFKTTNDASNRASRLVQDLIAARQRGVIINVLLEKSGYDPKLNRENQKVAARLKKEGIRVRFDTEKITTHTKIVVIDRRYCLVGSHNFTASALTYNHEASLLVDNQALANQLLGYLGGIQ